MAHRPFTRRQALAESRPSSMRSAAPAMPASPPERSASTARPTPSAAPGAPPSPQAWEAALAAAHAAFHLAGGATSAGRAGGDTSGSATTDVSPFPIRVHFHRTQGGEPTDRPHPQSGRLQLRLAPPGLDDQSRPSRPSSRALSATANVRLSAAAAGFAASAFYHRRIAGARAFAREMRLALEMGYERLEARCARRRPARKP